ncbi:MAG: ABC transporter permease [Acidobacteriia bacterium]|nr:ABC transporter permease [Terriglobia bacterium]
MSKTPGLTAAAILTLSLGIGANSAIFSVIDAILIRPLAYRDAGNLVLVYGDRPDKGVRRLPVAPPDFRDFAAQSRSFDQIGAFRSQPSVLTGRDLAERVEATAVSPSIFELLGVKARLGRLFARDEDQAAKNSVAILSDGLWRRRFGGDAGVLGSSLTLAGRSYTIIGVAPEKFRLLDNPSDLWIPYSPDPEELAPLKRGYRSLTVIAHLRPGVTQAQAETEIEAVARRIADANPQTNAGYGAEVVPLKEQMVGDIRPTLWTLLGAVAFVLLIGCANVANLMLARAGTREKEIAVRTSLGANPARLIGQLLTESVVLAVIGGLAGLLLAYWATPALVKLAPANIPRADEISLDWRVLVFTLAISVVTGIVFGLAPALLTVSSDLNSILKTSGRSTTGYRTRSRARDAFVVSEIAACVALLIGAGLLIRSFERLQDVNPGFRADHLLTMQISLPETRYSGLKVALFYQQLLERVQALPGVKAAGVSRFLPLGGGDASANFQIAGQPSGAIADQPRAKFRATSEAYFAAVGIPLLQGRLFDRTDGQNSPKVVIINDLARRRYWPNQDPIGKRIQAGFDESNWATIIGVVGNVRHAGLDAEISPETYYHYLQIPPEVMNFAEGTMALVLRTSGDPAALTPEVRNELRTLDPNQPVFNVRTMAEVISGSVAQPRFRTLLLTIFASLALLLAAIGLYGVMAYSVTQRVNELGVRAALGAQPSDILKLVVGHGLRLALVGIGAGVLLALAGSRIISRLLFGVKVIDPLTFGVTCLGMLAVSTLACLVPALKATRVEPAKALRAE